MTKRRTHACTQNQGRQLVSCKRSQAAMEFLMTYGWAILAAVIVVGVLWYMIGNPANLAGSNFQISAPLVSNALNVGTTQLEIEIRNGAAESLDVSEINIVNCGILDLTALPTTVNAGSLQAFTVVCATALTSGDRFNGDVTISYTTSGSSVTQTATGSISGRVP